MNNVVDPYRDWFLGLEDEFKSEVVIFVVTMLPDHPMKGTLSEPDVNSRFLAWMQASSSRTPEAVGLVLVLAAVTEFIFIQQRGTEEDWAVRWNRLDKKREFAAQQGNHSEEDRLQQRMLHAASISKSWIDAADRFNRLKLSSLSKDALHAALAR